VGDAPIDQPVERLHRRTDQAASRRSSERQTYRYSKAQIIETIYLSIIDGGPTVARHGDCASVCCIELDLSQEGSSNVVRGVPCVVGPLDCTPPCPTTGSIVGWLLAIMRTLLAGHVEARWVWPARLSQLAGSSSANAPRDGWSAFHLILQHITLGVATPMGVERRAHNASTVVGARDAEV